MSSDCREGGGDTLGHGGGDAQHGLTILIGRPERAGQIDIRQHALPRGD